MFKKFMSLIALSAALATSCSLGNDENKTVLASNFDNFLSGNSESFAGANVEEISANLEVNASFLVYVSETGCGACERFKPIISKYQKEYNPLIYNFDAANNLEELKKLQNLYGDMFFKKNEAGKYQVLTPSLFVVSNKSVSEVDYDSYMQKDTVFNNYMNSNYRFNNLYYTTGNVLEKNIKDNEFTYVGFDFSNKSLDSLFKEKVQSYFSKSEKQIVVSNTNEQELHLRLIKNKEVKKDLKITSETDATSIEELL